MISIKIKGVTREILKEALAQANKARAEIREVMMSAISEPRKELGEYAPKYDTLKIDVDKIKDVIGSGGKVINDIIEKCDNVKIDIDDDGNVAIYHMKRDMINKAKGMIEDITREAEIGDIFEGKVVRVEDYGAFVNLFGDTDGLCHVSRLSNSYVQNAHDVVKVGDTLKVKVIAFDDHGKVKLSHKEFMEKGEGDDNNGGNNERPQRNSKPSYNKGPKKDYKKEYKKPEETSQSFENIPLTKDTFKVNKEEKVEEKEEKIKGTN